MGVYANIEEMESELKFIELRAKGMSFEGISKELDVSKPTLIKWSKKHRAEIDNQRQLEFDHLRESLKLDRIARLKALGLTLEKLEKRIADADFEHLPLEKAIAAWTKLNELLLDSNDRVTLEGEHEFSLYRPDFWKS